MTGKRFILIEGFKKGTHTGIWDKWKQNNQRVGDELWLGEVVAMLNEGVAIVEENEQLKQENKKLQKVIEENEKLIQSTYNELSKLRTIKENLTVIKARWNWIMESIDYD